jgi:hypothetical protein
VDFSPIFIKNWQTMLITAAVNDEETTLKAIKE